MDLVSKIVKLNITFRLWIIILVIIITWILWGHLIFGCSKVSPYEAFTILKKKVKEGFSGMNGGSSFSKGIYGGSTGDFYSEFPSKPIDTNIWNQPNIGVTGSTSWKKIDSYKNTKLPLKDDQLFLFSQTEFKPECCNPSNTYSLSTGCACMNLNTAKYLWERGGNNIPYLPGSTI